MFSFIAQSWAVTPSSQYCYHWEFQCRNGQCINQNYLCNGGYDCYDGSDEDWLNCPRKSLFFILLLFFVPFNCRVGCAMLLARASKLAV
jgi:hypothetical protein